jgi:hypothetical protein
MWFGGLELLILVLVTKNQTKTEANFFIPVLELKPNFTFSKKIRPRTGFRVPYMFITGTRIIF